MSSHARTPRADHPIFQIGDCVEFTVAHRARQGRVGGIGMRRGPFGQKRLFIDVLAPAVIQPSAHARHPAGYALIRYQIQARAVGAGALRKIRCPTSDHPFWRGKIRPA